MDEILSTFQKNRREQVRVILSDFKSRKVLNIRVFEQMPDGNWLPQRKGLAFEASKWPGFVAAMVRAGKRVDEVTG